MTSVVVAFTAAISDADIQVAFVALALAEAKPIRIMSNLRLIDKEERCLAPWVGDVGVRRDLKLRDVVYDVSGWTCGVGDIESAVDRIRLIITLDSLQYNVEIPKEKFAVPDEVQALMKKEAQ